MPRALDRLAHAEDEMRLELHFRLRQSLARLLLEGGNIRRCKAGVDLCIVGMIGVIDMPRIAVFQTIALARNEQLLPHIVTTRLVAAPTALVALQTLLHAALAVCLLHESGKTRLGCLGQLRIGIAPRANRLPRLLLRACKKRQCALCLVERRLGTCLLLRRLTACACYLLCALTRFFIGGFQALRLAEIHAGELLSHPRQLRCAGFEFGQDAKLLGKISIPMQGLVQKVGKCLYAARFLC